MNSAVPMVRLSIYSTRLFENQADGNQSYKRLIKKKMNKPVKYTCPKCGSKNFKTGEIRTTGGFEKTG
jgi:predicted RNA-binding Zn-ribbon protein involved in translation (DUF1610 family)